ncbi:iron-sulfur cluster-binding protein, partial [Escherichia coli 95.0183]
YLAAIKILKIYPTPALYAQLVTTCVRCVFRCQN